VNVANRNTGLLAQLRFDHRSACNSSGIGASHPVNVANRNTGLLAQLRFDHRSGCNC
jgi:hypothetical protein